MMLNFVWFVMGMFTCLYGLILSFAFFILFCNVVWGY